MLGNQCPIFPLDFEFEGLDSWNYSFQNQTPIKNLSELDLLHQEPQSLTLFVSICNLDNKFLIIFGVFENFPQNQNADDKDWNIQFEWRLVARLWWCWWLENGEFNWGFKAGCWFNFNAKQAINGVFQFPLRLFNFWFF